MQMKSVTLQQIAALLNLPAPEEGSRSVTGLATLDVAGPDELSFLGSETYLKQFASTRAAAVIVQKKLKLPKQLPPVPLLLVDDADLSMAKVLELFAPPIPRPPAGVPFPGNARGRPLAFRPGLAYVGSSKCRYGRP